MNRSWEHPTLGQFKRTIDWEGFVNVSSLEAFKWDRGDDDHIPDRFPLSFVTGDPPDDTPSVAAVELVLRFIAHQKEFVQAATQALWDDFTGVGPDTGMYWHGHLEEVTDEDGELPPPDGPESLLSWMYVDRIFVRNACTNDSGPLMIEVTFAARFEGEHGVGILTDGVRILGTGYALDVEPFPAA
jgi:hypothetical protein